MKRKLSGPEEDRHHDRHSKQRKSENGHSKSGHEQEAMLRLIFKDIKDSLKRVQSATKDRIKSQKERANVMKVELVTIGNFIENLARESQEEDVSDSDLRKRFW